MPYYRWMAIDLAGKEHHGSLLTKSKSTLDAQLFTQGLGLVNAEEGLSWLSRCTIGQQALIDVCRQLSILLAAGVHMTQALSVLVQQCTHLSLKEIVYDVLADVEAGISFAQALEKHALFPPACVYMMSAGQEAGVLTQSLHHYANYLESMEHTRKRIRSAALVPSITFILFVIIALLIFLVMLPSFERMMQMSKYPVSPALQKLFAFSSLLTSTALIPILAGVSLFLFLAQMILRTQLGLRLSDHCVLVIPWVRTIVMYRSAVYFLKTLALLTTGGVHIDKALAVAHQTVTNRRIQESLTNMIVDVHAGRALSEAMQRQASWLFTPDALALVAIGQESGQLGTLLTKVADLYHQKLDRALALLTGLFQPLVLVILGTLIAGLIFIVYVPIFSLSDAIQF